MNRFAWIAGGGFLALTLTVNLWAHEGAHPEGASEEQVTIEGELIDTACFVAAEGDAKGADHAQCASKCLGSGIPAGILPNGKEANEMMFLLTNPKPFAEHAAKTIRVVGTAHPTMHAIDVKKAYVLEGGKATEIALDDEHHKMGGGEDAAKEDGHTEHKDGHAGHGH